MVGESGKQFTTDWYVRAFDRLYPIIYSHRSVEQARREVDFAARVLSLKREDAVLDLCCGAARHLTHLKRKCEHIVGLDYSWFLLQEARKHVPSRVPLVRGDMRKIPFARCFDVVCNFFTSFGYFESDRENLQVLQSMSRVLVVSGRFILDYLNPDYVVSNLRPLSDRVIGGRRVVEVRSLDRQHQRIKKKITIQGETREKEYLESVRLYTLHDMNDMIQASGLQLTATYGDFDGSPFGSTSPRMILTGEKNRADDEA